MPRKVSRFEVGPVTVVNRSSDWPDAMIREIVAVAVSILPDTCPRTTLIIKRGLLNRWVGIAHDAACPTVYLPRRFVPPGSDAPIPERWTVADLSAANRRWEWKWTDERHSFVSMEVTFLSVISLMAFSIGYQLAIFGPCHPSKYRTLNKGRTDWQTCFDDCREFGKTLMDELRHRWPAVHHSLLRTGTRHRRRWIPPDDEAARRAEIVRLGESIAAETRLRAVSQENEQRYRSQLHKLTSGES